MAKSNPYRDIPAAPRKRRFIGNQGRHFIASGIPQRFPETGDKVLVAVRPDKGDESVELWMEVLSWGKKPPSRFTGRVLNTSAIKDRKLRRALNLGWHNFQDEMEENNPGRDVTASVLNLETPADAIIRVVLEGSKVQVGDAVRAPTPTKRFSYQKSGGATTVFYGNNLQPLLDKSGWSAARGALQKLQVGESVYRSGGRVTRQNPESNSPMDAQALAKKISKTLSPLFKDYHFTVGTQKLLGYEDVYIEFYRVPPGASQLDRMNAPTNIKVNISQKGDRVEVWTPRSRGGVKMRKRSTAPDKAAAAAIKFFKTNADKLKGSAATSKNPKLSLAQEAQLAELAVELNPCAPCLLAALNPAPGTLPAAGARQLQAVFESALEQGYSEQRASMIAWGAVKKKYKNVGGQWTKKSPGEKKMATRTKINRKGSKGRAASKKASKRPRKNPHQKDYRVRKIVLDPEEVEVLHQWHGGMGSMVYSLASTGQENLVSASMIDAAVEELESDLGKSKGTEKKELEEVIGSLYMKARYPDEHVYDLEEGDEYEVEDWLDVEKNPCVGLHVHSKDLPVVLGTASNPFTLTKTDKKVIDAFTDKKKADSKKLESTGTSLRISGMGGNKIAYWKGSKIHFADHGTRAGATVERAVRKAAPKNWLASTKKNPCSKASKNPTLSERWAKFVGSQEKTAPKVAKGTLPEWAREHTTPTMRRKAVLIAETAQKKAIREGGSYTDGLHAYVQASTAYINDIKQKKARVNPAKKSWWQRLVKNPAKSQVDEHAVRELTLYADNEGPGGRYQYGRVYKQRQSIEENLVKKYRKGKYDHSKAPKLWSYWMETAAKSYSKDFAKESDWSKIFSKATRDAAAKQHADEFYEYLKEEETVVKNPGKRKVTKVTARSKHDLFALRRDAKAREGYVEFGSLFDPDTEKYETVEFMASSPYVKVLSKHDDKKSADRSASEWTKAYKADPYEVIYRLAEIKQANLAARKKKEAAPKTAAEKVEEKRFQRKKKVAEEAAEKWFKERSKTKKNPAKTVADPDKAYDLQLSANSFSEIYKQKQSTEESLRKRYNKGTYDHSKAPKLWLYWMTEAAKQYGKNFRWPASKWSYEFNKATRDLAAKTQADEFYEELKMDPPNKLPKKKSAKKNPCGVKVTGKNPSDKYGPYVKDGDKKVYLANTDNWGYALRSDRGGLYEFQFGAYGSTRVAVWEASLEQALEIAAEWLLDNAPGHITTDSELWEDPGARRDAMEAAGFDADQNFDDLDEDDKYKVQDELTTDMTYTESGYLTSYEWHVRELNSGPLLRKILIASVRETVKEEGELDDPDAVTYLRALKSTKKNPAKRRGSKKKPRKNPAKKKVTKKKATKKKASKGKAAATVIVRWELSDARLSAAVLQKAIVAELQDATSSTDFARQVQDRLSVSIDGFIDVDSTVRGKSTGSATNKKVSKGKATATVTVRWELSDASLSAAVLQKAIVAELQDATSSTDFARQVQDRLSTSIDGFIDVDSAVSVKKATKKKATKKKATKKKVTKKKATKKKVTKKKVTKKKATKKRTVKKKVTKKRTVKKNPGKKRVVKKKAKQKWTTGSIISQACR